jgi:hypothetical protein
MEAEVEPTSFTGIDWQPGTVPTDAEQTVHIQGEGLVQDTPLWRTILRSAATLNVSFHVVVVADEVCSRSRIYSFCKQLGLKVHDFSLRCFRVDVLNNKTTRVACVTDKAGSLNLSVTGPLKQEVDKLINGLTPFK